MNAIFLLKIKYFQDNIITIGFDDFYLLQIYYNKVLLNLYTYTTLNNIKIPEDLNTFVHYY